MNYDQNVVTVNGNAWKSQFESNLRKNNNAHRNMNSVYLECACVFVCPDQ